jgi:hypothetical protein
MEQSLDDVAEGHHKGSEFLKKFYGPFKKLVAQKTDEIQKSDVMKQRELGTDPASGLPVIARIGRFGPYVQLGHFNPEEKKAPKKRRKKGEPAPPKEVKPKLKSASLPKNVSIDNVTLEQALRAYFVSTSDVVSFLEELQSTGKAFGTTVEVVSVSSTGEGKAAHLSIALKIDGSFDGVVRTLGSLEYSPRDIVVNDAALGISGKAHWTATAAITVGTRAKPKVPAPVKPAATASTTATTTP